MMNAYWIETKVIEINEPINIDHDLYGYQKIDWGANRLVYANTRSQARYIFWRDCWKDETYGQDFRESMNDIKTIRLVTRNVDYPGGVSDFDYGDIWDDDNDCEDYSKITHPIWREIANRFWEDGQS